MEKTLDEKIEAIRKPNGSIEDYLTKGEFPFDYERQLLYGSNGLIEKILNEKIMPPLHFEILPTDKCNNNCIWCRGGHRNFMVSNNELSEEVMLRLMGELKDYGVSGIVRFSGMVGEPLMNNSTLKTIKRGVNLGLKIGLITNGILLTPSSYDYLRGITYISVSLDAGRQDTFNRLKGHNDDTFTRILDNIRRLALFREQSNENFRLTVGYVLHPHNYEEASEASELIKSAGADIIQFKIPLGDFIFRDYDTSKIEDSLTRAKEHEDNRFRVELMQGDNERKEELSGREQEHNFLRCYSQFINGIVSSDGNVYPCVYYSYQSGASSRHFGNIYEQSFRDIWEGERRIKAIRKINPKADCRLCNRYDHRVNEFIDFISSNGSVVLKK